MKKLKVAVTGGIGSGKSALCSLFEEKGYPVISSDLIAKEIMQNNPEVKKKIIKNFGKESYINDKLNKEYLAKKIFPDQEKISLINSIVHPATLKEIESVCLKEFKKSSIVFVESALVYEAKIHKHFDYVILVASADEDKITRTVKRDSAGADAVKERLDNQIPDEKKKLRADFVINNDSTPEKLTERGKLILKIIESISKGE